MKHSIRQHGQLTQVECELGSGILDKNGREIFEGDIVKVVFSDDDIGAGKVEFLHGYFRVLDEALDDLTYGCEVTIVD